jgi:hypothetical protein
LRINENTHESYPPTLVVHISFYFLLLYLE